MHTFNRSATFLLAIRIVFAATPAASAGDGGKLECLVEPYLRVAVSSAVPGVLEEVKVDRGTPVKKGQVLATLVSGVERALYESAKSKAAFAQRKVERTREMYRKQMISIGEKDELETQWELLKLEEREAEERLKQRTILSPCDGMVVRRMKSPGEYVDDKPILDLVQLNPLRVEVVVPVRFYGKIKVGMTGTVEWEAPIGGSYPATVKIVDSVVDAASGTIGVRLELPNPNLKLPAGTKCSVRFPVTSAP
jgi:RND family efflux transporter MFP subunit